MITEGEITKTIKAKFLRAELDFENNKINYTVARFYEEGSSVVFVKIFNYIKTGTAEYSDEHLQEALTANPII